MLRFLVFALLAAMLTSLAAGLYFLYRPPPARRRMAEALTWRILLAVALFATLLLAFRGGLIPGYSQ